MVSRKEGEDELPVSTLFLVRVVSLADVVILPFLQKMENRRLFAIFMSIITKKVTPKSAGWSLLTWATLASFCDGLQRRAALLLKRFPRSMRPHSMVAAGTLIRDQLVTCADPITAKQCLAKCLATYLAMFGNDKVFTDNNHLTSTVIPLGIYCKYNPI